MTSHEDSTLSFILELSKKAGALMEAIRATNDLDTQKKALRDLVTKADLEIESLIINEIREKFPDHNILSEEYFPQITSELFEAPVWIIDPVDGTTNYAHNLPFAACSIALYFDGFTQYGVVHAPFLNETFSAIKGKGAFLNGEPIAVSQTAEIENSLIATGFPYARSEVEQLTKRISVMLKNCRDLRRLGAASLDSCYVAAGRLDGYYEDVMPWDIAAGSLIAKEAGAKVGKFKTTAQGIIPEELEGEGFLVSNPFVFEELKRLLSIDEVDG